jgi:hypothetical protein
MTPERAAMQLYLETEGHSYLASVLFMDMAIIVFVMVAWLINIPVMEVGVCVAYLQLLLWPVFCCVPTARPLYLRKLCKMIAVALALPSATVNCDYWLPEEH